MNAKLYICQITYMPITHMLITHMPITCMPFTYMSITYMSNYTYTVYDIPNNINAKLHICQLYICQRGPKNPRNDCGEIQHFPIRP